MPLTFDQITKHFQQKSNIQSHITGYLKLFFLTLPVFLGILYVYLFAVDIPTPDGIAFVAFIKKAADGNIALSDLYEQHNEHRIFFPKLLILVLNKVTSGYNTNIIKYLTQILYFLSAICILSHIKNRHHFNYMDIPWWILLLPYLLFSWIQSTNMLSGFQISFLMPIFFAVYSFYFIDKSVNNNNILPHHFILASIFATISSFSCSMGLLVWIVGAIQLSLSSKKKVNKYILLWVSIGVIEWIVYFYNFQARELSQPLWVVFTKKTSHFIEFFIMLSGSFFYRKEIQFIAGIVLICLFLYVIYMHFRNNTLNKNAFSVSIALFSVMTIGLIVMGRGIRYSEQYIFPSRYITFSIFFIAAVYTLTISLRHESKWLNIIVSIAGAVLFMQGLDNYVEGYQRGKDIKAYYDKAVSSVLSGKKLENDIYFLGSSPLHIESFSFLKEKKYSLFSKK